MLKPEKSFARNILDGQIRNGMLCYELENGISMRI